MRLHTAVVKCWLVFNVHLNLGHSIKNEYQKRITLASVAVIPWAGHSFREFIVGFWLNNKLHRFATYSGAKIESLQIFDDHVGWVLKNHQHCLFLTAYRVQGGLLRGPPRIDMGQRVLETLNATVQVRLETVDGALVFEGVGTHTGLEVIGDLPRLILG